MESNFLLKYLDVRFSGELVGPPAKNKGMVVTMSRDTGCDGMPIFEEVMKNLNAKLSGISKKHPWRIASKEIFEESAKKLNLDIDYFENIESKKDRTFIEEILQSFSTEKYPSELKIRKTHKDVIESVAKEGGVFILGRAGVAIVDHNRRNLHIKVTAPLDWRIEKMAKEYGTTKVSAKKHILESDTNRGNLKKYYMGRSIEMTDYDVMFNEATLTKKEIAHAIENIILQKQK